MRGAVGELASPVPLIGLMPGIYQDDDFTARLLAAFDDAFAPILATLDGLAAYVDPALAPEDFLDWLAEWVGVELDEHAELPQRRALVAGAVRLHAARGTAAGIREAVELVTGSAEVTVTESGGSSWSSTPGSTPPGSPRLLIEVQVTGREVDLRRVDRVVAALKPAHVPHLVTVAAPD